MGSTPILDVQFKYRIFVKLLLNKQQSLKREINKAKYNWLVAQYNYRKNKEQLIEISDEEYERLIGETVPHTPTGEQYSSQAPTIIGTWKGNMAQIENYRYGYNETSYIESEITFLNNDKTYDEKTYNGI